MKLDLIRFEFGTNYTIGRFAISGEYYCFSLEREVKDSGTRKPAIPAGLYQVIIDNSTRFQRLMPHVLNVPGYEGIRIHKGNTDRDTEGCVLLGQTWGGNDYIGSSTLAFDPFFDKLKAALDAGDQVWLEIR